MMEELFNRKDVDYFWEFQYSFGEFLKEIFRDKYKRLYSKGGTGIYNLIYIDNKIYELKLTQARKMIDNDNKKFSDKNKKDIVDKICEAFGNHEFSVSGGKFITFKIQEYIGKIEIIKKLKEPI